MSLAERDKYSGHMTTGHEWNGIKELNTPVPKILIGFLIAAFVFAVGYWIAMPAWPLGDHYTKGTLGFDQRDLVQQQLVRAAQEKSVWSDQIEQSTFKTIVDSPELMQIVNQSGPALFEDNCAMCHGTSGDGTLYFPRLNDQAWLWGERPDEILHTLTVGINSRHEDTRFALMPAFGDAGVLTEDDIADVVSYLVLLSDNKTADNPPDDLVEGKTQFGLYCAGCHGADGGGNSTLGAPRLNDNFWIYGNDVASLTDTLKHGRQGYMPAWDTRLSLTDRKILTLYVLSFAEESNGEAKP